MGLWEKTRQRHSIFCCQPLTKMENITGIYGQNRVTLRWFVYAQMVKVKGKGCGLMFSKGFTMRAQPFGDEVIF